MTPSQRLREFSQEPFTTSRRKLFCRACRQDLSLKLSVITNHTKSVKHSQGKEHLKLLSEAHERDIPEALKKYNTATHPEGETLPVDQQVYRIRVLASFLRAGMPLNTLRHFMWKEEQQLIKSEIQGRELSVVFDGATRLDEAVVILVRYVTEHMEIQQRLLRVQMVAKCMTGTELARELISVLSVNYSVPPNTLLAAMRDRASVDNVALRTLKVVYPFVEDVGCFSHTINLAGEHFKVPTLSEFVSS